MDLVTGGKNKRSLKIENEEVAQRDQFCFIVSLYIIIERCDAQDKSVDKHKKMFQERYVINEYPINKK